MTLIEAARRYPSLIGYIMKRNNLASARDWCAQLRIDESEAADGGFSKVAQQMEQAQADHKAWREAQGHNGYPYNSAMGEYLGLALNETGEPKHGYYMASCVASHYRFGVARREATALIEAGRLLRIVSGRSKADNKPVRFYRFVGPDQIKIEHDSVALNNGKRSARLSSNWSIETCLQNLVTALRHDVPFGERVPS